MAIDVDVDAAAVIRLLRYLEREYRGLRLGVGNEPGRIFKDGRRRLESQLGRALSTAYGAGLLPVPIASDIAAIEQQIDAINRRIGATARLCLVPTIIGYQDLDGHCYFKSASDEDGEADGDHQWLIPGNIRSVWPEIFDGVRVKNATGGINDPAIMAAVLGLYAEACRLLADWAEENPTGSDARGHYFDVTMRCNSAADVRTRLLMLANQIVIFKDEDPGLYQMFQQMDYPEPGPDCSLGPDGRVLVWYGRSYPLTRNMAGVVGILFEAWKKGRPEVSIEALRGSRSVDSSTLNDSFSKVFQRRVDGKKIMDPVYGVIETVGQGLYRLADPPQS
jgi:hypothetical protein